MPVIFPATSERNFTPNSAALSGPLSAVTGGAVPGQIVATAGRAAMVRLNWRAAVCTVVLLSYTLTVKVLVPETVGVPAIAPLAVLSDSPGGSDPLSMAQAYGSVPPLAVSVAE